MQASSVPACQVLIVRVRMCALALQALALAGGPGASLAAAAWAAGFVVFATPWEGVGAPAPKLLAQYECGQVRCPHCARAPPPPP